MGARIELLGHVFGNLTVIGGPRAQGNGKKPKLHWECQCKCGAIKWFFSKNLRDGKITHCGCLPRKYTKRRSASDYERTRRIWQGMIQRCHNPNNRSYKYYGARGIVVCDEWRYSFEAFLRDMGLCPPGLTIERLDVNGSYYKDNTCWATAKAQANNKRDNRTIEYDNQTKTIAQWAELFNLPYDTLYSRLRIGMSFEKAIMLPVVHQGVLDTDKVVAIDSVPELTKVVLPSNAIDMMGQQIERLTVIDGPFRKTHCVTGKKQRMYWWCECRCGVTKYVLHDSLKDRKVKSCGCAKHDVLMARNTTHGKSNMKEYAIWSHMIQRCYDPNSEGYQSTGKLGIKVCDEWRHSFERFIEDMGPRPDGHLLIRLNTSLDFTKDNCRWATRGHQSSRSRVMITYNEKTQTLQAWGKELEISASKLYRRIVLNKWPIAKAFADSKTLIEG